MKTQTAIAQPLDKLKTALATIFPVEKVDEILFHFEALKRESRIDHYDTCLVHGGKFVEAVLKCLHYRRTQVEVNSLKVEDEINQLANATALNDSERMTIPRILRAIYECRNKRGGAHNTSFDPIKMDCVFIGAASNWILEEFTRLYMTNNPIDAQELVQTLLAKEIPLVEQIDGDSLVQRPGLSARVHLEILLFQHYPARCSLKDLIHWAHNHSERNIRVTLSTMKSRNLVHETEVGWKLSLLGVSEAEAEIEKLQNGSKKSQKKRTLKSRGVKLGRK